MSENTLRMTPLCTYRSLTASLTAACIVAATVAPVAGAWRQEIGGATGTGIDIANAVAVDGAGDAIVAGSLDNGSVGGLDFTVIKLSGGNGAEVWRQEIEASSTLTRGALSVAVDGSDDVVVAGELDIDFTVIKLAGASGAELWRVQIDGTDNAFETFEEARSVLVDAAGDVIATGFINNAGTGRDFVVVKLAGATGAELWRYELDGGDSLADDASGIAIDLAGNVVACGRLAGSATEDDFAVVKLSGATGSELWQVRLDGSDSSDDAAFAVAVDAVGDVAVAGMLDDASTHEDFVVVKLGSAGGAEIWRRAVDGSGVGPISFEQAHAVAFDAAGDVIAGGDIENLLAETDMAVMKLDGASGAEIWRRDINGNDIIAFDALHDIAIDASDDVIAGGRLENGPGFLFDAAVIKLSGATGEQLWRQDIDGDSGSAQSPGVEAARAVALDAAGDVVAVGHIHNKLEQDEFAAVKLDGATGTLGPVGGSKLAFKDLAGQPARRKVQTTLRDRSLLAPPPGSPGDPTTAGADLLVVNPSTLEAALFAMPAGAAWQLIGSPTNFRGYKYKDSKGVNGPCKSVVVRSNGSVKASCIGKLGAIPFSLDEPTQGSLTASVRFGGGPPQCATFGGKVSRDAGTANPGPKGSFKAVQAPPPLGVACP